MTHRNNTTDRPLTAIEFNYPSQDEIAAMVREAHHMRAQAVRESARWLWAFLTRRRPDGVPAAPSATAKA